MQAEFDYALNRHALNERLRIVPILLQGVEPSALPAALARVQAVHLSAPISTFEARSFRRLAAEFEAERPVLPEPDANCPFRESFDTEDSRLFFGRDAEINDLISRIRENAWPKWIHIQGSPGVGKTSFIHAAVIPALERGWGGPALRDCRTVIWPSGQINPITGFRTELSDIASSDETDNFILVVDDIDVVAASDGGSRKGSLSATWTRLSSKAALLLTEGRSDITTQTLPPELALPEALGASPQVFVLSNMSESALRDVIEGPARLAGLRCEGGLLDLICRDAKEVGPAALPVLMRTLRRLWNKRLGNLLTHAAYQELGGLVPTLTSQAEEVLKRLPLEQQDGARRLLLGLVNPDGKRRVIDREEAASAAGGSPQADKLLATFIDNRLIVPVDGTRVQLVHDRLVEEWPRFKTWIQEAKTNLERRNELENAASACREAGRPNSLLPTTGLLQYYQQAESYNQRAREFLEAASAQERERRGRERVRRRLYIAATLAALISIGSLAVAAWWQSQHAAGLMDDNKNLKQQLQSERTKVEGLQKDVGRYEEIVNLLSGLDPEKSHEDQRHVYEGTVVEAANDQLTLADKDRVISTPIGCPPPRPLY
jgi:hypothetical protein